MIFVHTYAEIESHIGAFNNITDGNHGQIQKAFSTAHFICLVVRYPRTTRYLYIGRGNHYEAIMQGSSSPPPELRVKEKFLEYIRKYLVGKRFNQIVLDKKDRIIHIPYFYQDRSCCFSIFWKGRTTYFTNYYVNKKNCFDLFVSWKQLINISVQQNAVRPDNQEYINHLFDEVGRFEISKTKAKRPQKKDSIDNYIQHEIDLKQTRIVCKKKIRFLQRKLEKISKDLQKVQKWRIISQFIEKGDIDLTPLRQIDLPPFIIKFDSKSTHYQKLDIMHKKLKSYKKADQILQERLRASQIELDQYTTSGGTAKDKDRKIISLQWPRKQKNKKINRDIIEFLIDNNFKGAIGKNSRGNDYLRNSWSKPTNYWFHFDGLKGPHVVVAISPKEKLSPHILSCIGSLMRDHGKFTIDEIPIIYTKIKNIKGLKGHQGAVTFNNARHTTVLYDRNWIEIIKLES